jgi:hypothetical protein
MSEEDKKKYWIDNLHFTKEGYDRMAEVIFNELIKWEKFKSIVI